MGIEVVASGGARASLLSRLTTELGAVRPPVMGVASAYLSAFGATELAGLIVSAASQECRLIAGIDGEITHPTSLKMALDHGWKVRIGAGGTGIFHPKIIVGGRDFAADGLITDPCCLYVGSGNITRGGLVANVECGIFTRDKEGMENYAVCFRDLWGSAQDLTRPLLRAYAAKFANRNRQRSARDLVFLGVADYPQQLGTPSGQLRSQPAPADSERAIETQDATVAWAGLQSFTGEFQFQIEFPRAAGEVLQGLVGDLGPRQRVQVECEDGATRSMTFRFYEDNSMFRLNVPNDVPGVVWARANKDGIAAISRGRVGGPPIRLRVLRPGRQMDEIVSKSVALGTWGKTTTRLYGWM